MRCTVCGEELREGAKFCPVCGSTVVDPAGGAGVSAPRAPRDADPAWQPRSSAPVADDDPAVEVGAAARAERASDSAAERVPPRARASRDPAAGYDPVAPARPAPGTARRPGPPSPFSITSGDFQTLSDRIARLARLDTGVFADVYKDQRATIPLAIFAAVALIVSGIGGLLYIEFNNGFDVYERVAGIGIGEFIVRSLLAGTIVALIFTAAWAGVTMLMLNNLLGRAGVDFLGILRVLLLALAPLVLSILMLIEDLVVAVGIISVGGTLALAVIGILEAVDVKPGHAWLATLAGFAVFAILLTLFGNDFRDFAPGIFMIA